MTDINRCDIILHAVKCLSQHFQWPPNTVLNIRGDGEYMRPYWFNSITGENIYLGNWCIKYVSEFPTGDFVIHDNGVPDYRREGLLIIKVPNEQRDDAKYRFVESDECNRIYKNPTRCVTNWFKPNKYYYNHEDFIKASVLLSKEIKPIGCATRKCATCGKALENTHIS